MKATAVTLGAASGTIAADAAPKTLGKPARYPYWAEFSEISKPDCTTIQQLINEAPECSFLRDPPPPPRHLGKYLGNRANGWGMVTRAVNGKAILHPASCYTGEVQAITENEHWVYVHRAAFMIPKIAILCLWDEVSLSDFAKMAKIPRDAYREEIDAFSLAFVKGLYYMSSRLLVNYRYDDGTSLSEPPLFIKEAFSAVLPKRAIQGTILDRRY